MSSDVEQEYFSDGISEELLNLLPKVPNLRVISRSSSFAFKGRDIDIPTIAAQLNVAHILEGSVRKTGNKVRITAQLIEARTDTHLWTETYDRELNDIFVIQDEISAAIVAALRESLGLEGDVLPKAYVTKNSEAYEAYLSGAYQLAQRIPIGIEGSVRAFSKAVELDPDYAPAHAQLAIATLMLPHFVGLAFPDAITLAEPQIEQAMTLDPTLAEAYAASGFLA
jgi:TolB-like protein